MMMPAIMLWLLGAVAQWACLTGVDGGAHAGAPGGAGAAGAADAAGAHGGGAGIILDLLRVLAAAALVTMGLRRLKLATIPGYLITGALIGPAALGMISSDANIAQISGLAIVLLMFIIGLHLDVSVMGRGVVPILAVGVVSTVASTLLLWPVASVMGAGWGAGLAVAMALSMSSTAVVLRLLQQAREMHRLHGRLCVGISIVQDLLSLVMLASLPALAAMVGAGGQASAEPARAQAEAGAMASSGLANAISDAAIAIAGVAGLILFGRIALPAMLREASRERSGEATLVLSAAVALGAAVFTAWLGFSPELGAFMAGFLLASTPFKHQLAGQLSPMRDLFMAVFFTTVGLKLDLQAVAEHWWVVLVGLPVLLAIKAASIGGTAWALGASTPAAGRVGLTLAQAGEFSIVVLAVAAGEGLVGGPSEVLPIVLVVLSLIITPTLSDLGRALQPRLARVPAARWLRRSWLREPTADQDEREARAEAAAGAAQSDAQTGAPPSASPERAAEGPLEGAASAIRPPAPGRGHAVIAGFGVIGRAVADRLEVAGVRFVIVEMNAETVRTQRRLGRQAVFGDIGNPEVLESADVHNADAVFITVPDDDAVVRACLTIRQLAPQVFVAARTSYLSTAFQIHAAGADDVTIGEVAIAEAMARHVINHLSRQAGKRGTTAGGPGDLSGAPPA